MFLKDLMSHRLHSWILWPLAMLLTVSAHAAAPAKLTPNVVLVHGAFADGSSWSRVIPLLLKKGYHVTSVQLPLTSLADDVAATRQVLARQQGDVVLVGHSWGGVVVTEAGNDPMVKKLVYISAMAPDSSESAKAMLERHQAPMVGMVPDAAGLIWLDDPKAFHQVMGADLSLSAVAALTAVQKPIAARSFGDVVSNAAWRDKPSWYLVTKADHALPPRVQRSIADQLRAQSMSIFSSHLSLASHPKVVADLIDRAARAGAH